MRTRKTRAMLAAGSMTVLLAVSGCAGASGDTANSEGSAETVAVDVGDGMTVDLSTASALKVGVFIPGVANEFGLEQERAVEETAEELGLDVTLFDAGYDPSTQLNQLQTAMNSGDFDAAVVMALDPTASCKILTEDFPEANILTSISGAPLCTDGTNPDDTLIDEIWSPGTLNFVGSNNTREYADGWFAAAAKENPGEQHVLVVTGPAENSQTRVAEAAMEKLAEDNSDYTFDWIYTDWTTTDAYNKSQTYLQGNSDVSVIMSASSPDLTQGVIQARDAAGLSDEINIVDQGLGDFQIEQIETGNVQLSTLLFPYNGMKSNLESIVNAQSGDAGPRFVDDSLIGTAEEPFGITQETISELPPELR